MEPLYKYLGIPHPQVGDYGIELECELGEPISRPVGFDIKEDGSLRGMYPIEIVSRGPIKEEDLNKRVNALCTAVDKARPDRESRRTSLHVHINCLHLSPLQIINAIVYSWCIESIMLKMCAPHRQRNKFCTPFLFGEYPKLELDNIIGERSGMFHTNTDCMKYSATAIHCLNTLGTIEFRAHEFTSDPTKILEWCSLCSHSVYYPAKAFNNPVEVLEEILEGNIDSHIHPRLLNLINKEDILMAAMSLYHIIYKYNWDSWAALVKDRLPQPRRRAAQPMYNLEYNPNPAVVVVRDDPFAPRAGDADDF